MSSSSDDGLSRLTVSPGGTDGRNEVQVPGPGAAGSDAEQSGGEASDQRGASGGDGDAARRFRSEMPPIVALGASAGALKALESFFSVVSPSCEAAFVVIQHLSPDFKSLMKELLSRHTGMEVLRVEDGMTLRPRSVYLIPPKKDMWIEDGRLRLADQVVQDGVRVKFPIDLFFESMAEAAGPRGVAVVLSGAGTDGTRGVRRVHERGGIVLAQSIESAQFDGMPRSAITTGLVDEVHPPEELARRAGRVVEALTTGDGMGDVARGLFDAEGEPDVQQREMDRALAAIVATLRREDGVDFAQYRESVLRTRILRRVVLGGYQSPTDLAEVIAEDPARRDELRRDLLVRSTCFFRDADHWDRLAELVIDPLVREADADQPLRVWVTACSTGEEVYTLAMLLHEAIERQQRSLDLKIFATDVDPQALEQAGTGLFPESIAGDVGPVRLKRWFTPADGGYQLARELRESLIFARHDLTRDAPFTRMHLVTCRNAICDMQPGLQRQVLAVLHFALRKDGVLMLGAGDLLGELTPEFDAIDDAHRIYRKLRDRMLMTAEPEPRVEALHLARRGGTLDTSARPLEDLVGSAFGKLLHSRDAACLLANESGELIHVLGEAHRFLRIPEGRGTLAVTQLLPQALATPVQAALHRLRRSDEPLVMHGVRFEQRGETLVVDVRVVPGVVRRQERPFVAILIEPASAGEASGFNADSETARRMAELEDELRHSRENLQATIEELETTNEEQQATNEELLASNEELQSTNEELHSVNEELYTVNAEYQSKINELTDLNNDMVNLLRSTEIGTVFLDRDLLIRKFTPAAKDVINLIDQDVGRPIRDISNNINDPDLPGRVEHVLRTGQSIEGDVTNRSGASLLMRLRPYRNEREQIEGVVLTFVEITQQKRVEQQLKQALDDLASVNRELREQVAERRHAEEMLRERNEALASKHREMEQFVYTVSHDLKSPLVTISGMLGLLRRRVERGEHDAVASYLDTTERTVVQMRDIIEDLLELSRLGFVEREHRDVDLSDLVDQVLRSHQSELEEAGFKLEVDPELPTVRGDRKLLGQVFDNLVVNAIKYGVTEGEGPSRLRIAVHEPEAGRAGALLSISDHGRGIDPEHRQRAFDLFHRLDGTQMDGTGVGLAIVKRIVELHGGRVWIDEAKPCGACFWLWFPDDAPEPALSSNAADAEGGDAGLDVGSA